MSTPIHPEAVRGADAGAIPRSVLDHAGAAAAAAAGVPDPALLARLAGEFFGTLGRQSGGALTDTGAGLPPHEGHALPVAPVALDAYQAPAQAIHLTPAIHAAPLVAAHPPLAGLPAAPAAPGIGDIVSVTPLVSGLGFLADLRSIETLASASPASPALPFGVAVPPVAHVAPDASASTLPFGISRTDIGAPLLQGVPAQARTTGPTQSEILTTAPRHLAVPGVSPTLAPVGSQFDRATPSIPGAGTASSGLDVQAVRRDFPILQELVNGRPLVWLDNAATTQKPQAVIDRLAHFYAHENSNVHRAAHTLAARATDAYEGAREKVRAFLNASSAKEIVFVRGTTEGINLIARSWGKQHIHAGDEIVLTHLEHHANIVPWQMLCAEVGATLKVAPVDETGQIILAEYEQLFTPRTRLAAFSHVSNALGTVTPVHEMTAIAHRHGAAVVVDGAQSVSHIPIDVQAIDCDFFVFSGHKIFGPTGIGVVYGKSAFLEQSPPYQGGGNMIVDVTFERTIYHAPPLRFEAGTGNIADAVGLGAALDYVTRLGMANIARREHELLVYGTQVLTRIPGLTLVGTAREKTSVLSFVLDGHETEDVGAGLARQGIAVRAGHHCAQPILRRFGHERTVRPSLAFYNTCEELDQLGAAIRNIQSGRVVGPV
ncbi:Cysteine desulfurase [Luteitalea pratensis]|uniref:Cysteine desulfurase n=1 Tax=Luteitalea pratensis TaxID=1855912 RepID=A0A143PKF2_LUTPR|nr:family 2A encapsulin nanocompartment cargo protein cysteine desulfurase [Luteitalea pratensis]AMY08906.1 Cysteine desulfurase [Luteitalea pratensis]